MRGEDKNRYYSRLKRLIVNYETNILSLFKIDGNTLIGEINNVLFGKHNIKKYYIMADSDEKLCDTCYDIWVRAYRENGLPMDEYDIGKTAPPMHPNCRCQAIPVVDGYEELVRRMVYQNTSALQQFINLSAKDMETAAKLIKNDNSKQGGSLLDAFINWFSAYGRAEVAAGDYMAAGSNNLFKSLGDIIDFIARAYSKENLEKLYDEHFLWPDKEASELFAKHQKDSFLGLVSGLWKSASETFALMGLFALMAGETVVEGGAYLFTGNSATLGEPYFMTRKYFETLSGGGILDEIDKQVEPWVDNKEAYRLASIVGTSLVTAADYASIIWSVYEFAARIGVKVLSGKSGFSVVDDIAGDGSKAVKAGDELAETVTKGSVESWYKPNRSINYPPNNGRIPGSDKIVELQPGDILGRYGDIRPNSNFVTQPGASPGQLSLPPNTDPSLYTEIKVLKPISGTTQSTAAPWAGSPGMGLQYELPDTILNLERQGFIEIIYK